MVSLCGHVKLLGCMYVADLLYLYFGQILSAGSLDRTGGLSEPLWLPVPFLGLLYSCAASVLPSGLCAPAADHSLVLILMSLLCPVLPFFTLPSGVLGLFHFIVPSFLFMNVDILVMCGILASFAGCGVLLVRLL